MMPIVQQGTLSALPGNRDHDVTILLAHIPRAAVIALRARRVQPRQIRDAPAPSVRHMVPRVPCGYDSVRHRAPELLVEVTPDGLAGGGDAKVVTEPPRGFRSSCTCVLHNELEGPLGEGVERRGI